MKTSVIIESIAIALLLFAVALTQAKTEYVTCHNRESKCFYKYIKCPYECPEVQPQNPNAKGCFLDCYSPKCEAVCRSRKPNCDGPGAACYDPRFIGGDGIVFYFHGKTNQHFTLVSDPSIQINARFIGLRPQGRSRDYTWIQSLGLMFGSHNFTLHATKAPKWEDQVDHLQFSYNGEPLVVPEGHSSKWISPSDDVTVLRTSSKNSVAVTVRGIVEVFAKVVPVTEKDSLVHHYQIPSDDSFAHLEVQFRFLGLSPEVEGVLGRTYRPDFENPAKPGVAMPVVGGDDKYFTSSLLSADCNSCVFKPGKVGDITKSAMSYGTLDCTGATKSGYGILCKK